MNHPKYKEEFKKLQKHIFKGFEGPRYENKEDYLAFFRDRFRKNGVVLKRYYDTNKYSREILDKYVTHLVTYYQLADPNVGVVNNFIYQLSEGFHFIAVPFFNPEKGEFYTMLDISFVKTDDFAQFMLANEDLIEGEEKKIGFRM